MIKLEATLTSNDQILVDIVGIDGFDCVEQMQTYIEAYNVEYLKVKEVADRLRVSIMTVNKLIHNQELEAIKIMGVYRIPKESLDKFVSGASTASTRIK